MASVLVEYFRAVFIKRRWTVMTATPFIVFGLQWLFNHLYGLPSDLRQASIWEARWWLWALSIVCCFSFAQFLAWRDEHRRSETIEQALRDREEDHRSDRTLRDAVLILSTRSPGAAPAEVANAVNELVGIAAPIPISATLRVLIPDGDVLVGDIRLGRGAKNGGRYLTAKVLFRIRSSFTQTGTVLIRVNDQLIHTSISIPASTSGTVEDLTNPFWVPLPQGVNLIEIQAILLVGDKKYPSDSYPLLIGD
jgi:hypothetical protein